MSVFYRAASGGVPECFVLLLEPDWSEPVQLTYALASEQSEGLTGIEYRVPAHRSVRVRQAWTCLLDETEAAALREALASLAGRRFAMPIWPDAIALAPMHAGQKILSWDDAGSYAIIDPIDPAPYARNTPLVVGRIKARPTVTPIGGKHYTVEFDIQEDSPFELRIDPASGTTPGSFTWEPDWAEEISDLSRDQLRVSELGQGREAGVAGTNGTPRWGESAGFGLDRDEAVALLRFWVAHRGSVDAFSVPAWGRPGVATPLTPDTYQARFDADTLTFVFRTPTVVECSLKLWQQVTLSGSPPPSQAGAARGHCYTFRWEGGTTTRLTSWEHSVAYGGQTWVPARISKMQMRTTMESWGDECDVAVFAEEPGNPIAPILAGEAERRLSVEIAEVVLDAAGVVTSFTEIFTGEIRSAELKGDKLVGKAASFGGIFSRKIPRFYIQNGCNYSVFSGPCGLAKATWAKTGPIGGTLPGDSVTFVPGSAPSGTYADKWFAAGWLEVTGTDGSAHSRAILDCSESSGTWTLKLNRLLPATCAGQTASVYPGCDGNYSTCKGKFANGAQFGGHPFTPAFIATSEGTGTSPKMK